MSTHLMTSLLPPTALLAAVIILTGCDVAAVMAPGTTSASGADNRPGGPVARQSGPVGEPAASDPSSAERVDVPPCADYDSWRRGPDGTGIIVTYWFEGTDPVTVAVGHPSGPDLAQTVAANDPAQRYRQFAFLDLDPQASARVLVTTAATRCVVQPIPPVR